MKYFVLGGILLLIGIGVWFAVGNRQPSNPPPEKTEEFIHQWLQNENGTLATYILENEEVDEDLVQGREALAETVGLVLLYALEKEDQVLFDQYYEQLDDYFIETNGFVNWKLNEAGESEVSTNALIDDLRIMDALVRAEEKWGGVHYVRMAEAIGNYLTNYTVRNGVYTDFYETLDEYASENIQLSYIDVQAMETLTQKGFLDVELVENTTRILLEAPLNNGFYPLSYNVETETYTYDEEVNLMNQAILVYHLAQVGVRSEAFLTFIKQEINERKLIHGVYHLETKEPAVDYESPAIYGYLISYALLLGEMELAEMIYARLKDYQVTDEESEYYGGYSITDGNTHIFDNLIPLLAEQALLNEE